MQGDRTRFPIMADIQLTSAAIECPVGEPTEFDGLSRDSVPPDWIRDLPGYVNFKANRLT